MTKEDILAMWTKTGTPLTEGDKKVEFSDLLFAFSRELLYECAKIACFMCKDNKPVNGIHRYSAMSQEPCRAAQLYLED